MKCNRMREYLLGIVFAAVSMVSGCAYIPQSAELRPNLEVASEDLGKGATVAFRVVDEREAKSLGNRGSTWGKGARITTDQDVAALVHNKIADGLQKKGFKIGNYSDDASPRLSVELRSLEYGTSVGFWTGGVQVQAALKALASRRGKNYERMYRFDNEKRVIVVPTKGKNEELLNAALTDVLKQFFDDVGMLHHLAGK